MVKQKYTIIIPKQAQKDFKKIQAAGLGPKVKQLYDILCEDPFRAYPSYEALRGELKGFYSRRINIQHRLVYSVDREKRIARILRMWTHYE